jgi:hypothetical protein
MGGSWLARRIAAALVEVIATAPLADTTAAGTTMNGSASCRVDPRRLRRALVALAVATVLASTFASAGSWLQSAGDTPPIPKEYGARLLLLAPEIVYEDQESEQQLDATAFAIDEVRTRIVACSRRLLESEGFVLEGETGENSVAPARLVQSGPLPSDICAGSDVAERSRLLLAIHARVIVGRGGSWNPLTGAITSANHHTRLRAALVDCAAARVLWRNEVILREVPDPRRERLEAAIERLLAIDRKRERKEDDR